MPKLIEDPDATPPKDGYQTSLVSTSYKPIRQALITLMEESGELDHVSTWFPDPVLELSDKQFPTVFTSTETDNPERAPANTDRANIQIRITYYAKHLIRYKLEELEYFAEVVQRLIRNNRRLNLVCVISTSVTSVEFIPFLENEIVISECSITLLVKRNSEVSS